MNIGGSEMIAALNAGARDWANARAAEMVGMKWVDGELVENPNAEWAISDTTREEINRLIKSAFEKETPLNVLIDDIQTADIFSDSRAEMIARTEVSMAQSNSNYEVWKTSGVVSSTKWLLSFEHDIVCECNDNADAGDVLIGELYPGGTFTPPAHPLCFPAGTVVTSCGDISAQTKRWYAGKMIRFRIEGVEDLVCTPNHPILSSRGVIPACEFKKGDDFFFSSNPRHAATLIDPDNDNVPSLIENISNALLMSGDVTSRRMKSAAEDFHGDGMIDDYVDIVRAAGGLKANIKGIISRLKKVGKFAFIGTEYSIPALRRTLYADSTNTLILESGFTPESGGTSSLGIFHSLFRSSLRVSNSHVVSAYRKSVTLEELSNRGTVTADCFGDLDARLPAFISTVKILDIQVFDFAAHVYNLETSTGFYFANGILSHNCKCSIVASTLKESN